MLNFWQAPLETVSELLQRKAPHLRQIRHFASEYLGREVEFDVYLPPDYHLTSGNRYPLIIFNDGQDLPRMHFARILGDLYYQRQIPHGIVVGVYANHDRMREYGTARQVDYMERGDKAPAYTDFILRELLPYLSRRFRVTQQPSETIFAGFSLGGLSALDIAWAHPHTFGTVGIFSGALWWRWSPVSAHAPDADRIMHDIIDKTYDPDHRQHFWFQCGTRDEADDRNNNGVIDSIDDTLHLIEALRAKGFAENQIRYVEIQDGTHDPKTWGEAMPDFLRWVLPHR